MTLCLKTLLTTITRIYESLEFITTSDKEKKKPPKIKQNPGALQEQSFKMQQINKS